MWSALNIGIEAGGIGGPVQEHRVVPLHLILQVFRTAKQDGRDLSATRSVRQELIESGFAGRIDLSHRRILIKRVQEAAVGSSRILEKLLRSHQRSRNLFGGRASASIAV